MTSASRSRFSRNLLAALLALVMSAACAQQPGKPTAVEGTVPFQITFTPGGEVIVLSKEGERLKPVPIKFPLHTREVAQVYNFNAFHGVGSSYIIYCIGPGYCFCINLPNPDGTPGNACQQLH